MTTPALIRAGIPLPGGRLVEIARDAGVPVLFSANAFMRRDANGEIASVRLADRAHFGNLNAALDSAGFVAACAYFGYPWSIEQYLNLVESYDWAWYSTMDFCVEPEVAGDQVSVMLRVADTLRMFGELRQAACRRGLPAPMPVLQGWKPSQYVWCAKNYPLTEWPELIGVGSVCRRHLHGDAGILAVIDALDKILPPHTKLHLFGVKGQALESIGRHPRLHSIDSMGWDFAARRDHPTGRTMDIRGQYMLNWVEKNKTAAARARLTHTPSLLPIEEERISASLGKWLDLVLDNELAGDHARGQLVHHFDELRYDDLEGDDGQGEDEEHCGMGMA